LWFLWLVLVALLAMGCEPEDEIVNAASNGHNSSPTASVRSGSLSETDRVVSSILKGDFEDAAWRLSTLDTSRDKRLRQLERIVSDYKEIETKSETSKTEARVEEIDKLEELRKKYEPDYVVDANEIGEIVSVVIRAREYSEEAKKAAILANPFVKKIISTAVEKGSELDSQGEWVDAYAYCYYWLVNLDEDNKEYKELAERMSEKALIEMSLKDDSCGKTSKDRHEGIRPEMVIRAIRALEINYVAKVDYGAMAKKGVSRCRLLGEVLTQTKKDLNYKVDSINARKWEMGIEAIEDDLADSSKPVTNEKFKMIFGEILALNSITIGIPEEVVIAQFAESSFGGLDPHTTLVWPWQVRDFQKMITKQFIGIGVEISKATGTLKVVSLLPDTPAYRSGLDAGDEILEVNGESTEDMTIVCAVSKITGKKGTKVTLTIRHAGSDDTEDITIVRDRIIVPPIRGWQRADNGDWRYIVDEDNRIGYIRITDFTETTATDMEDILDDIEKDGLNGLIVDLRFNSGGYLVTAAGVVDLFVEKGLIVKSQPKSGVFPTTENAHKQGTHPNYPLVVLINGQSASASEIVAGALQDPKFDRATLVGSRSYGKGSVQVITPYTGGDSQLKYTIAYYHLPSGQRVKNRYVMKKQGRKDWGIMPDVEVKLGMNELREMVKVQRANEILVKADHDSENPVKRHSIEETLKADKQLAVGLLVIKSKMVKAGRTVKFSPKQESAEKEEVALGEQH
jgi:carboxyl-terminal processing protease